MGSLVPRFVLFLSAACLAAGAAQAAPPTLPPVNAQPPAIAGNPIAGDAVSCDSGTWTGRVPITFAFQWMRDSALLATAQSQTYVVSEADAGHALACVVTATNADGSAVARSAPVHVSAIDQTAPRLTKTTLSPQRFRALRSGGSVTERGRGGTVVRFRVNERATLTGRAQRYSARTHRYSRVKGSFSLAVKSGAGSFRFSGRIGGHALAPGRYRLVLVPRDAARNTGAAARPSFVIVR